MTHANLNLHEPVGDTVKTTTCYMCACRCGIKRAPQGWQASVTSRAIAQHPVNKGVICAQKVQPALKQHYSPARLSKPLLRIGERGAGEFREIEWDEALSTCHRSGWQTSVRAIRTNSHSSPDATSRKP
jgi:anaerobic selenocysteine-containing dehydrogenase